MELRSRFACILCLALAATSPAIGAADGALDSARAAIRLKDYRRAVAILEPAARAGEANAQYLLASLHRVGLDGSADPFAARELLKEAASRGHAAACYSLAMSFAQDEPRNETQAREWLQRAAASGHALAQAALQRGSLPLEFLPHKDLADGNARRAAFWLAVQHDDAELVGVLADPQLQGAGDEFGRSALHYAAQRGAVNVIAVLIQRGASIDQRDASGMTPLMLAAANAPSAAIESLLQAGTNADAADRTGNTALMYAAARDSPDPAVVTRLLQASTHDDALNLQGWSALDWAIAADAQAIVELLQREGLAARRRAAIVAGEPQVPLRRASSRANDLYAGLSDLEVAASRSSPDLLDALRRADLANETSSTALYRATVAESAMTVERVLALSQGDDTQFQSALLWAATHADSTVLKALVSAPERRGSRGESPVIAAVRAGRIENLQVLLDAGYAANAVDENAMTPLMIAAASGQSEAATDLCERGALRDAVDSAGRSALWHAANSGHESVVQVLLKDTSVLDAADTQGQTPLHAAAAHGHARIVAALLRAGARASPTTSMGITPLMSAAANGNRESLRTLLDAGTPINAQNEHGDTALIVAVRSGNNEAVKLLLAAGADARLRNADRASALDVANALGRADIESVLARN